jgi:bifunctional DNase/RNase
MKDLIRQSIQQATKVKYETILEEPQSAVEQFSDNNLIQVFPFGLSVGHEMAQPVMIFKSNQGDTTLPVLIDSLEAGVTLAQSNRGIAPLSPHKATQQIFEILGVKLEKCIFVEVKSSAQYVKIFFKENENSKSIKVKACDAISLCLHLEVPIYTTKEVVVKSRVLVAEVDELKRQLSVKTSSNERIHPYIN